MKIRRKKKNPVVERARKEAEKDLAIVKKDAKEALAAAKAEFNQAEKIIDKKIRTHPEEAVLVAAAIGAAVGALATYGALKKKKK